MKLICIIRYHASETSQISARHFLKPSSITKTHHFFYFYMSVSALGYLDRSTFHSLAAAEAVPERVALAASTEEAISDTFSRVVQERKFDHRQQSRNKRRKMAQAVKDEENYIPYQAKDHHTEAG